MASHRQKRTIAGLATAICGFIAIQFITGLISSSANAAWNLVTHQRESQHTHQTALTSNIVWASSEGWFAAFPVGDAAASKYYGWQIPPQDLSSEFVHELKDGAYGIGGLHLAFSLR